MSHMPLCSAVISYEEDIQQLILQVVEPAKLASGLAKTLRVPILLDEFDFNLDDEFVRRFGCGVLTLLALGQPVLNEFLTATRHPLERPNRSGDIDG